MAKDFDAIGRLGVDHLRVMLLWPYFQPNPATVSGEHLGRLSELLDCAEERGIEVVICPLTGWLSGYKFLPPWVGAKSLFGDKKVFASILTYFEGLLETASESPAFLGFDLGNEINVLAPELPRAEGDSWAEALVLWLRARMGHRLIVNGVDHAPWFSGTTFSTRHLVEAYDAVALHCWPLFTGCLQRGGLTGKHSTRLAAFMTELASRYLHDAGLKKPVWIQEFGASGLWGSGEELADYMEASVENAINAGASWFTWWCSHDIDRAYRFEDLEYDLGLLTTENEEKSLAGVYREIIGRHAQKKPQESPRQLSAWSAFSRPAVTEALPSCQWLEQNLNTTTWALFEDYLAPGAPSALRVT